jgi:hypothetical protein
MKTVFLIALVALGLFSCKKYSDGGIKKLALSNLRGTWKLERYTRNDVDYTGDLLINSYKETFNEEGTYSRQLIDTFNTVVNTTGGWDFEGDRSLLRISGAGFYSLTPGVSTATAQSGYTINRLTKSDLWYSYEDAWGKHNFRLIKQ